MVPSRWWVWPLAVYAVTRVINAIMINVASGSQITYDEFAERGFNHYVTSAGAAPEGYQTIATNWDAQWYWEIAVNGYPLSLPTSPDGDVSVNPWAFYPLFPMTVRGVMWITSLGFPTAAILVSLVAGAAAILLLHSLVARRCGNASGLLAVIAVCTYVCAPVFQIAYSEGLALLLVVAVLHCLSRQRYLWCAVFVALLGLTRGVAAAMALAIGFQLVHLWRRQELQGRQAWALSLLAGWSVLMGVAWVVFVGWATGVPNAYRLTQSAWRHDVDSVPVLNFITRNSDVPGGVMGAALLAIFWTALLISLTTFKQAEPMLRFWSLSYVLFILAVMDWVWSNLRYFILVPPVLWPLVNADQQSETRSRIVVASFLGLVGMSLQWWWIRYCLVVSPDVVQVP